MDYRKELIDILREVSARLSAITYPGLVIRARDLLDELDPQPVPFRGQTPVVREHCLRPGAWVCVTARASGYSQLYIPGDSREQAIRNHNAAVAAIEKAEADAA